MAVESFGVGRVQAEHGDETTSNRMFLTGTLRSRDFPEQDKRIAYRKTPSSGELAVA